MSITSGLPISKIKVRVPYRRRELITRTRLMDALYDQMEKQLLFIVAPAGYGKTSLLVDLAQQAELPICWLSLDTLDQEPQRFLRYLIAAIAERFPEFGRDSLAALESLTSIEQDEERLLVTITNEVNAQIHEHFILVLDDYHLVANVTFIGHVISRFMQLTSEYVHLILATRSLPQLPDMPLMIARNHVGGLSFEDLSFYPEEIQQLFEQNNGIRLSRQDAQTLVKETEGWIAAIHLTNGHPGTLPQMHPLESTRELFDFFSGEVLLRQSEEVRSFMLLTSLFDTFDVTLCEQVLEPLVQEKHFDWPILFETVRTGNLFSVPLDNEGRLMRYHHLFQHFLRSQLQYEQPVLAWHIQQNLARAYEEQQSWEEALEIYARLEDHDNQARVLTQASKAFAVGGRIFTLANWLDRLPGDVVLSHPGLVSLMGMVHSTRGDDRQALELLDLAESRLRENGPKTEWIITLLRRAEACRQLGYYERAQQDVERILEAIPDSPDSDMQHTYAATLRLKGLLLFALGNMRDALTGLQEALRAWRAIGSENMVPIVETELGVVHRRLGEPEITAQYYSSALKAWENAGHTGWKARLLNNLGLLHHVTGRLDEAYPLFQEALKTSERSGYMRVQTNVLISLGDLFTDLSDYDSAYTQYDNALTMATNLGYSLHIFYASLGLARLQRLKGAPVLAVEELRRTEISQVKLGSFERAVFNLELGCCWLDAGKPGLCIAALSEAIDLFRQGGNQMEQTVAQLWLAIAASFESPEAAVAQLRKLIPPQRDQQKPTPLMIQAGRAVLYLKNKDSALLHDPVLKPFFVQAEQIAELIPPLYQRLTGKGQDVQPATPRLEIFSFGDVQVRLNQKTIGLSDWQTREARDLFFFLLHSRPLTKEQIALVFWPDISPARLKVRFKINMYRIRQAIGQDSILFENERYQFNRNISFSWDRDEFDRLMNRARQKIAQSERITVLEQATALIRGEYLANLDAEWAVPERLKYQDLHCEALLDLAALYLQDGRARDCLNTARQVLQSDALLEAAHRLIIQAYASLHDPANMTLQYRQYQQALENELGIEPSSEISTLYEQLLAEI